MCARTPRPIPPTAAHAETRAQAGGYAPQARVSVRRVPSSAVQRVSQASAVRWIRGVIPDPVAPTPRARRITPARSRAKTRVTADSRSSVTTTSASVQAMLPAAALASVAAPIAATTMSNVTRACAVAARAAMTTRRVAVGTVCARSHAACTAAAARRPAMRKRNCASDRGREGGLTASLRRQAGPRSPVSSAHEDRRGPRSPPVPQTPPLQGGVWPPNAIETRGGPALTDQGATKRGRRGRWSPPASLLGRSLEKPPLQTPLSS
jgi:hypothetical protein